jgi:hypothetical protein
VVPLTAVAIRNEPSVPNRDAGTVARVGIIPPMLAPATIFWFAPARDRPGRLMGRYGEAEEAAFATIGEALAWARARSPRIVVSIEGLGSWEQEPDASELAAIDAHLERGRERGRREAATYPEPVEWFFAVLGPDTRDPEGLARAVARRPQIAGARVHRRMHRGEESSGSFSACRLATGSSARTWPPTPCTGSCGPTGVWSKRPGTEAPS